MLNVDEKSNSQENLNADEFSENEPSLESTTQEEPLSEEDDLKNEIAQLKDQLLRALAETENVRRRADRERKETADYAITKFARDLLSLSDNLSRALETVPAGEAELSDPLKNFIEGIRLTEREMSNIFERYGIKKIMPLGEKFDHNWHQAMFEIESADQEPGTVLQVLQAGYKLQDRLLRPAMVGVSKA